MFQFLARWLGRRPEEAPAADGSLLIQRWRLETPIRLVEAIRSKAGSNFSNVGVVVDVRYVMEGRTPVVRSVKVSTDGANVFSHRTGEAWHVPPTRIPADLVDDAVRRDVSTKSSKLAAKMLGNWKRERLKQAAATA